MARKGKRSPFQELLYGLRYRIGEYCLRGFVSLLPWIPRRLVLLFTAVAARLTFLILWRYRLRMEENLAIAMGREFPTAEKRRDLVRRAWRNFAQGVYETASIVYSSKEAICSLVAIRGEEALKQALAKGKGVVALSAHLGNFTMLGARLAVAGYPTSVVVKHPRDRRFARLTDSYRAQAGVKTISAKPRREAVREILKALRKNEVVLLIADEFKSGGAEVEFLGQGVSAPRGPATVALRTGAPVIPMVIARDPEDRLTLHIGAEVVLIRTGYSQKDVDANVALLTRHLENMVRRYPEQWNWLGFHRNGRRPKSEIGTSQPTYLGPQARIPS